MGYRLQLYPYTADARMHDMLYTLLMYNNHDVLCVSMHAFLLLFSARVSQNVTPCTEVK